MPPVAESEGAAPAETGEGAEPDGGGLWNRFGGWVHGGLDVAGLVPSVGEIADGINAAIYLAEGDYVNAGLSAAAMIPFAGWGATGTKLGVRATREASERMARDM